MPKLATAQSPTIHWSTPVNLSNSPASSGRPAIVADGFGYVHLFWSEEVGGESILNQPKALIHDGNTIFYTRWDGVLWTPPIDVLFVPSETVADYIAVTVDSDNNLHAVWTGQSNLYYSIAPSWQALSGHNWSKPVIVATDGARSPWAFDIVTDAKRNVHIIYATRGDEVGVYHISSIDSGTTWESPIKLSQSFDRLEKSFSNVKIIADEKNHLHAVWQTNEREGYGQAAYYAHSVDGGATWTTPFQMGYRDPGEYGVSFPHLVSVRESELHLIYIDGPWHIGRYHRMSHDGGETWSEPLHILDQLEGINGYTIPLVDGAGGVHLIVTMRTRAEQTPGTFYARWLLPTWSPTELAVPETQLTGPGAHWTAATVRLGNEIHVVWNTNFSNLAGEIWHSRGTIPGVAQIEAESIPVSDTPLPAPTTLTVLSPPVITPTVPTPWLTHVDTVPSAKAEQQSSPLLRLLMSPSSQVTPLLIAAVPTMLLIAGVIIWMRRLAR